VSPSFESRHLQDLSDHYPDHVYVEGLGNVVVRAQFDELDGGGYRWVPGNYHYRESRVDALGRHEGLDSVEAGHHQVCDNQVVARPLQEVYCLLAIVGCVDLVLFFGENFGQERTDYDLDDDDKYAGRLDGWSESFAIFLLCRSLQIAFSCWKGAVRKSC